MGVIDKNWMDEYHLGLLNKFNETQESIEKGEVVAGLAKNLESWAEATQNAEYVQGSIVDTTGGTISIDSSVPASLISLAAKTDFAATSLVATGFNLLRYATALGSGWYILVPALPFGIINTANEPNGVLFTNAQGNNLRPTVYFKPLSAGVPSSVTDGTACTYVDAESNGKSYRFYTTSEPGYMIISGIDRSTCCAHIGWSKRYDEYISVTDESDVGSTVNIAAGIHALHSYDLMLNVGNTSDRIERTGDNQITWYRLVDRITPTWTNTPQQDSQGEPTGNYIHEVTISTMKANGLAQFATNTQLLTVEGTKVSYIDDQETGINDYIKFELATPASGTTSVSSTFAVEDWGLIFFSGATGEAFITLSYAQNIMDSLRAMLSNIDNKTVPIISEAIASLFNEYQALKDIVLSASYNTMDAVNYTCMGNPMVLEGAGAPTVTPKFVGQRYHDTTNRKVYEAFSVNDSTNDWVALN